MFKTRLISSIFLVLIALVTIIPGGWILYGMTLVISLIGVFELYRATGVREKDKGPGPLEIAGYIGVCLYYISIAAGGVVTALEALLIALIVILYVYVFTYPRYQYQQVMTAFFGIIYVAVMLSFIYLTRMLPGGKLHVWLIFLCSWGCDTCAYCVGRLWGKHKMAPVLSPKKSIEGGVGGIAGAIILGVLYALLTDGPVGEYAVICGVGAMISMVGDLAASAIKRNTGIKDYGTLIPGHGGILDRFDSVIFTAPVIYYLAAGLIH